MSSATAPGMSKHQPPELIEVDLMETFHWTPQQIDEIPMGRLQTIFATMEQRSQSSGAASEMIRQKQERKAKSKEKRR